jgi:uncharacterized protein (TIGR02391 family)
MTNKDIIELLKKYRSCLLKLRSRQPYDYQETRSFLNKNRPMVQRILIKTQTLKLISVAPPALTGGYVMQNVNPLDYIFNPPYGLDIHGHLSDVIEQAIGIIEADPDFAKKLNAEPKDDKDYDIWSLIHPSIAEVSKKRIKDGYYADAVEAACKTLNARVRDIVLDQTGEELDGAGLMRKAFSPGNPIIRIASPASKSGHDTQQGYMEIYAGVMTGIRNPKAHDNEMITKEDALRKLVMISLLMYKIDGRVISE